MRVKKNNYHYMHELFVKIMLISVVLTSLGCSTFQDFLMPSAKEKSAKISWEKDMKLVINGQTYHGIAQVPWADSYEIKIYPSHNEIDRVQFRTCHRGGRSDRGVYQGTWPWSKGDEYLAINIVPAYIELSLTCTLDFEALTKRRKSMSFGSVVFPDPRSWFDIEATNECDGKAFDSVGTSVCQAPVKSIQRISFMDEVTQDSRPQANCPPLKEIHQRLFEYSMPKDQCVYSFKNEEREESSWDFRSHRLITYGYEKSPPEERD